MNKESPIIFSDDYVAFCEKKLPLSFVEDNVAVLYEVECNLLTDILIVLTTPRSGSSAVCNALFHVIGNFGDEYFNRYSLMPVLAKRWECIDQGVLDEERYIRELLTRRTAANGWASIKVLASQVKDFDRMREFFPRVRIHYLHLIRKDLLAQAVSLSIASQTGQWRSDFKRVRDPVYDYDHLLTQVQKLQRERFYLWAYIRILNEDCSTITYEDFVDDPAGVFKQLSFVGDRPILLKKMKAEKQATSCNKEWIKRFSEEYLAQCSGTGLKRSAAKSFVLSVLRKNIICKRFLSLLRRCR
jgi:LPS sulfotransferase NodH